MGEYLQQIKYQKYIINKENILHIKKETEQIGIFEKVTAIQIGEEYILKLDNDGITINLGDCTDLKNRIYYVQSILEKEAGNRGTINVNGNLNEGFLPYFTAEQIEYVKIKLLRIKVKISVYL